MPADVAPDASGRETRVRRAPPPWRTVAVERVTVRSPRLLSVRLVGEELTGFAIEQPAASVRLLLPPGGAGELVLPRWDGNVHLLPDGRRATVRTLTPRRFDPAQPALDVEVVVHEAGVLGGWATTVAPGGRAAVSGPARGYAVPADTPAFLLLGDESAVPAIGQLLEWLPAAVPVTVHVELATAEARTELPVHPGTDVTWHVRPAGAAPGTTLLDAVRATALAPRTQVWAAGEAAAMQAIRRHCFEDRGVPRADTWIRGYWKLGRAGDDG